MNKCSNETMNQWYEPKCERKKKKKTIVRILNETNHLAQWHKFHTSLDVCLFRDTT